MTTVTYTPDILPMEYDLDIHQGETKTLTWTWQKNGSAMDISAYSAKLQIRSTPNGAVLDTRTTSGGGITCSSAGVVVVTWTAAQTAAMNFVRAVYDLYVSSAGGVTTYLLKGDVKVSPRVSQ